MITYEFLTKYDFDGHIAKIREVYRRKAELCMSLVEKFLTPKGVEYFKVEGGLFVWCKLPDGVDMLDFTMKALENKVAVVPGTAFLVDEEKKTNWFRINFSTPSDEQIEKGIEILGSLL
jgi:2-aminoadipate transaminase